MTGLIEQNYLKKYMIHIIKKVAKKKLQSIIKKQRNDKEEGER